MRETVLRGGSRDMLCGVIARPNMLSVMEISVGSEGWRRRKVGPPGLEPGTVRL